jgi:hypothetical protein
MDIRYAAGLFDGEGYVRVARWEKPNSPHVRYQVVGGIGMTYLPVIEALHRRFGGSINQNRHDLRNPNARIQFTWHIASQTAASFFRKALPHLIVKRDEVELALKLQDSIDEYRHKLGHHHVRHPERDKIFAYRANLASQIYALKKRAFAPLVRSDPSGSVNGH